MAQENENKNGRTSQNRQLPAVVMVVVGAILGGAGVVLLTEREEPESDPPEVISQDAIEWVPNDVELDFHFNPQTERGKAFGKISFTLAFLVQPGKLEETKEMVATRLVQAKSRCLELLSSQRVNDLRSPEGKKRLKRLLKDELTYSLFPGFKGDRIAIVENIFWTSFLIQ